MIFNLNIHSSRVSDVIGRDTLIFDPPAASSAYRDSFGNWCTRVLVPPGQLQVRSDTILNDRGLPDAYAPWCQEIEVQNLPEETLLFLLGSRYCETDRLCALAWQLFGQTPPGWTRVQAICDFVQGHIVFGYEHARMTRTALEAYYDRTGVCRDYTHLAIAFCRCMNIPARYCTGYLSDAGLPPPYSLMDLAAWMEVFLTDGWHTFDPRNNTPRRGRVLIARGRDAADVAISNTFGPGTLDSFRIWADVIA